MGRVQLGAAKDAVRMSRVVDFYTKLPKYDYTPTRPRYDGIFGTDF